MKVNCVREQLLDAASIAEKVSAKQSTLPVLSCILLKTHGNTLRVRATNLELGIEIDVPCKVVKVGECAVSAPVLVSTLSHSTTEASVELEVSGGNLTISTPTSKTTLKGQPTDDFPTLPVPSEGKAFSLSAEDILKGLRAVWYAASVGTVKPELASVYVKGGDGKLTFAATDSFRLAEKTIPLEKISEFDPILVPLRNVSEIIRTLESAPSEVAVRIGQNQLSFTFEHTYITSRLVNGSFPDYKQIIPKEHLVEAILLKHDLTAVLKKSAVFSDKFNQVVFHFIPLKKQFEVSAKRDDVGEMRDILSAALSGEELEIAFNHRYVFDCLSSIQSDSISLSLGGQGKPMVMRGVSDSSLLYLVMPMNR